MSFESYTGEPTNSLTNTDTLPRYPSSTIAKKSRFVFGSSMVNSSTNSLNSPAIITTSLDASPVILDANTISSPLIVGEIKKGRFSVKEAPQSENVNIRKTKPPSGLSQSESTSIRLEREPSDMSDFGSVKSVKGVGTLSIVRVDELNQFESLGLNPSTNMARTDTASTTATASHAEDNESTASFATNTLERKTGRFAVQTLPTSAVTSPVLSATEGVRLPRRFTVSNELPSPSVPADKKLSIVASGISTQTETPKWVCDGLLALRQHFRSVGTNDSEYLDNGFAEALCKWMGVGELDI